MEAFLTAENIYDACKRAEAFMEENRVDPKEVVRQKLTLEDVLLRYQEEFGEDSSFALNLGKRFGRVKIRISVSGLSLDPFVSSDEDDDVNSMMQLALRNLGKLPAWRYSNGRNIITFTLTKKQVPEWVKLIAAIALAILCGLLLRSFPEATRLLLQQSVITPVLDAFIGFLNAVAGPMVFLAVVWGMYSIGDASTFSMMGKKLAAGYSFYLCFIVTVTALISMPFFELNFGQDRGNGGFSEMYQMVLDIIPTNLFTPFSDGNTLQILMLGIVVGIALINIGEKTQMVADLAEQLGTLVNTIMAFIGKLVPYFVFGSLLSIILTSELSVLSGAAKLMFCTLLACLAILALHTVLTSLRAHISPAELWRNGLSTFIIGLSTASSSAALSDNLKSCIEKFRISPELANFAVPLGQIIYKPGTAVMFWFVAICEAEQGGLAVSIKWLITAVFMCIILSAATPPVPGGGTASFSILFVQMGLPMDGLAIVFTLNVLADFFRTAANLFAGQCVLLNAATKLNMVMTGKETEQQDA